MKYRFGSFNMNNMGMSAMTGRDFDRIAEIIKRALCCCRARTIESTRPHWNLPMRS